MPDADHWIVSDNIFCLWKKKMLHNLTILGVHFRVEHLIVLKHPPSLCSKLNSPIFCRVHVVSELRIELVLSKNWFCNKTLSSPWWKWFSNGSELAIFLSFGGKFIVHLWNFESKWNTIVFQFLIIWRKINLMGPRCSHLKIWLSSHLSKSIQIWTVPISYSNRCSASVIQVAVRTPLAFSECNACVLKQSVKFGLPFSSCVERDGGQS